MRNIHVPVLNLNMIQFLILCTDILVLDFNGYKIIHVYAFLLSPKRSLLVAIEVQLPRSLLNLFTQIILAYGR